MKADPLPPILHACIISKRINYIAPDCWNFVEGYPVALPEDKTLRISGHHGFEKGIQVVCHEDNAVSSALGIHDADHAVFCIDASPRQGKDF